MATAILTLSWNAAQAPEGILHYRLYSNGIIISNTSELEFVMNNVQYNTSYTFYVTAVTNTNRVSAKSNIITIILQEIGDDQPRLNYNLNFDI